MDPCASLYNKISYVFSSVPFDGPLCDHVANSEISEEEIILKMLTRSSMPLYKDTSATLFRPVCGMERWSCKLHMSGNADADALG